MGVKTFAEVFGGVSSSIDLEKNCKGMTFAIDASVQIYQSIMAFSNLSVMTDNKGETTAHIKTILSKVFKFAKMGIKQIWVFDNPEFTELKENEIAKRKEIRKKNEDEISDLQYEMEQAELEDTSKDVSSTSTTQDKKDNIISRIQKLETRTRRIKSKYIEEIKELFDIIGQTYIQADKNQEAEGLCARLVKDGYADAVLSTDSDSLAFGAKMWITPSVKKSSSGKSKKTVYDVYLLKLVLEKYDITQDELVDICIALGTDFAPKMKGIGPKTVIAKLKSGFIEDNMTEEQLDAKNYFMSTTPQVYSFHKGKFDKTELMRFLGTRNFALDKIEKNIVKTLTMFNQ